MVSKTLANFPPPKTSFPTFHHQEQQDQLIFSLISRIEALEASLHHYSSSSHHSHSSYSRSPRVIQTHYSSSSSHHSRIEARVIQTHIRAFLVRKSQTLRQLKDLAFIKSAFTSLKSSISSETHLDFHAISQKSINLLLKLDTVSGTFSVKLQARYGGSYALAITTTWDHEQKVEDMVQTLCSNSNKVYQLSGTQKFELPKSEVRVCRSIPNSGECKEYVHSFCMGSG